MSSRLPADQRRRQLLEIACRVFADNGFHASAMDDIAGAAARNDQEFAAIVDRILEDVAEEISLLIEIPGTAEHRRVLAHAVIGIAEATSRDALTAD